MANSDAADSDPAAHGCTARPAGTPASTPASTLDAEQVRGGTAEQRHAQPAPAAETAQGRDVEPQAQSEPAVLHTEHGSSSRDAQATEGRVDNTGAAAQPSDDSEEEEQEVGWKRLPRARSSSPQPSSKQKRCDAAGQSTHGRTSVFARLGQKRGTPLKSGEDGPPKKKGKKRGGNKKTMGRNAYEQSHS